jgi:hypothetical protein
MPMMKPALLALTAPALVATPPAPPEEAPILRGPVSAAEILAHRAVFRDQAAEVSLSPGLKARWAAIRRPFTLVAVFGSWCSDSVAYLPDLLVLEREPNPFIEVHYLGVGRDKALPLSAWPKDCPPRKVSQVPSFYLFTPQPGGGQTLVGVVVESPPKAGQSMAEALVELLEGAARR